MYALTTSSAAAGSLGYTESLEVLPRLAATVRAAMCADVSRTTHAGGDWSPCPHENGLPCSPVCCDSRLRVRGTGSERVGGGGAEILGTGGSYIQPLEYSSCCKG